MQACWACVPEISVACWSWGGGTEKALEGFGPQEVAEEKIRKVREQKRAKDADDNRHARFRENENSL